MVLFLGDGGFALQDKTTKLAYFQLISAVPQLVFNLLQFFHALSIFFQIKQYQSFQVNKKKV